MSLRLRLPAIALLLLSITACSGGPATLTFQMTVRQPDAANVQTLISAAERVVARRINALGEPKAIVTAVPSGGSGATLTIMLPSDVIAPRVKSMLAEPFVFDIRLEQPAGTGATAQWNPTGIVNADLRGARSVAGVTSGEAAVELEFSTLGRYKLDEVFRANKGKNIGIFVRDLMVSSLSIDSDAADEHIIISGIPSSAVAQIFADDVNVGLYVDFKPL